MESCIFCKIIEKKIPKEFLYEDDLVVAFADLEPLAPVHILIIPKEHIPSISHLPKNEKGEIIAGRLVSVARDLAKENDISEEGYKLLFRTGKNGGQEVPHIHLHLIGGAKLSEDIHPC